MVIFCSASEAFLKKESGCLITGLFTPAQTLPAAILSHHQTLLQWHSFQKYLSPHKSRPERHSEYSISPAQTGVDGCYCNASPYCGLSVWRCCGLCVIHLELQWRPQRVDERWSRQRRWHWAVYEHVSLKMWSWWVCVFTLDSPVAHMSLIETEYFGQLLTFYCSWI